MTGISLADRVSHLEGALAEFPHAFGGALALAYYADPRSTVDIDINIFVPTSAYGQVAAKLAELGVDASSPSLLEIVNRDGQVRVFWDETPLDLFFSYDAFHDAAEHGRRSVPFADGSIEVLSPEHLMVCKVVFNRPKDWVDLDAMLASGAAVDAGEVIRWVVRLVGDRDARYTRVVALLTHQ